MFLDLTEQTIFIITLSLSTDPSFLYRFFYVEKYICVDGGQQQMQYTLKHGTQKKNNNAQRELAIYCIL